MHSVEGNEEVLQSPIVLLEGFLQLVLIRKHVSFFYKLCQLFWLRQDHFDLRDHADDVVLGEHLACLLREVLFFLELDAEAQAKVPQNGGFAELVLEEFGFGAEVVLEFAEGDGLYLLPEGLLLDGLFGWFFEGYFEDYLVVFAFFLPVLLGVRAVLVVLRLLLDADISFVLRKQRV